MKQKIKRAVFPLGMVGLFFVSHFWGYMNQEKRAAERQAAIEQNRAELDAVQKAIDRVQAEEERMRNPYVVSEDEKKAIAAMHAEKMEEMFQKRRVERMAKYPSMKSDAVKNSDAFLREIILRQVIQEETKETVEKSRSKVKAEISRHREERRRQAQAPDADPILKKAYEAEVRWLRERSLPVLGDQVSIRAVRRTEGRIA